MSSFMLCACKILQLFGTCLCYLDDSIRDGLKSQKQVKRTEKRSLPQMLIAPRESPRIFLGFELDTVKNPATPSHPLAPRKEIDDNSENELYFLPRNQRAYFPAYPVCCAAFPRAPETE